MKYAASSILFLLFFALGYGATFLPGFPRVWYYPILHTWSTASLEGPAMGWFFKVACGTFAGAGGWLLGLAVDRWRGGLASDTGILILAWMVWLGVAVYITVHQWIRWLG